MAFRQRPDRKSIPLAVLLVVSLAPACVSGNPMGSRVAKGETEVVFGVPTTTPGAGDSPSPSRSPSSPGASTGEAGYPEVFESPGERPRPRPLSTPIVQDCPPDSDGTAEVAPTMVVGRPAAGHYRWLQTGTWRRGTSPAVQLRGSERREVRDVSPAAPTFTYDVVRPESASTGTTRTTYRVKTDEGNATVDPRGIAIAAVRRYNGAGNSTQSPWSTFQPTPPLMLLPLPVAAGEPFSGRSIDTAMGVVDVAGQVRTRERLDLCGELIDGWRVTATHTYSKGNQVTKVNYDYIVATQLGGLIIAEHVRTSGDETVDALFTLAQARPDRGSQ